VTTLMKRPIDNFRSRAALVAALCLGAFFAAVAGSTAAGRAVGADAPRVSLSVPAEVSGKMPATAEGKVVRAGRGHVELQAWRSRAWHSVAAGKVRHGRFRISFVVPGPASSALRLRAALVRGRHLVASSAPVRVRLRAAEVAPGPPADPSPPPPAVGPAQVVDQPLALDSDVAPGDLYWGAWIGSQLTGTAAPWDMGAVAKFEQLTGKPLSMVEFSTPFADCSSSPCSYFGFPSQEFSAIRAHGAIPFFSWGSQSIPGSANQPDFQLADILAGSYDIYIREWAARAAEWGHPFFLRFDWEMNGSWFAWGEGANGNQPGEFAAAWRHVHDIFTSAGATNATWVWCPYLSQTETFAPFYPGDSYVDWTCLDGYNWGTNPSLPHSWRTFSSLYAPSYADVTETLAPSKPMMIGELGSTEYGGSKATWIEEMFEDLPSFPRIRGFLWFETFDTGMDWPIETSEAATAAFADGIADDRYLGNAFADIGTSPIPAPDLSP
jgi:Glycosyl hydrolase family 26